MEPQVLEKSSVTIPQELERPECVDQVSDKKIWGVDGAVIIIRWLSILFCLAFWYGIYTVIKLLIES
jgi:hypothetical protein